MLHANFMALFFVEPKLWPVKVLHSGNRDLFAPVTLTLSRWPS